jgi:hypothetical protein
MLLAAFSVQQLYFNLYLADINLKKQLLANLTSRLIKKQAPKRRIACEEYYYV